MQGLKEKKEEIYQWIGDIIDSCVSLEQLECCKAMCEHYFAIYKDDLLFNRLLGFIERVEYKIEYKI